MVTTVDSTHHIFIKRALERGVNVITEKPMVTEAADASRCSTPRKRRAATLSSLSTIATLQSTKRSNRSLSRARSARSRRSILAGISTRGTGPIIFAAGIGSRSGGGSLWVHKATHHFDLINWWLDADPVEVSAYGALERLRPQRRVSPHKLPPVPAQSEVSVLLGHHARTRGSTKLYSECEDVDGYHRDGCVFKEDIDIYDTMSAVVRYSNGASMTYSLNAHADRRLSTRVQRHEGPARSSRLRTAAVGPVEHETEMHLTRNFGKRGQDRHPDGDRAATAAAMTCCGTWSSAPRTCRST